MPKLQVIHNLLSARPDPCVDQAVAAALPTADGPTLADLAAILLNRRHTQGGIALVEQYHRLPDPTRQAVLRQAPELTRALRLAMGNTNTAGPANALHIIRRSASVRLAYLVPDQLRHGPDSLKDEAALCLLEMAGRTTADDGPSAAAVCDAVETAFVVSAVRDAIRFYAQHQRKDVLQALFALPLAAVTELLDALVPLGEAWTQPTGVLLTRSDTPAVRRGLVPALAVPPLQAFALDGIGLALETGHATEALRHWHLLCLRPYRQAVKRAKNTDRFIPGKQAYDAAGPDGRTRGLVVWLDALPLEPHTMVRQLGELNRAPDPLTRLASLRRLLALAEGAEPEAQIHHAIAGFCNDPQPPLVRIAITHLIRRDYPDIAKVLAQLINSPDPRVQRIASKRLVPVAFARLWDSWPKLDGAARMAAGRALIKIDPNFHAALHDKLCLPDPAAKTRALSIIADLNQGLLLQDMVLRCTRDSDVRVVASAVKALGSADPERVLPNLEVALEHEDDRVRANAVEALAQLDTGKHADLLVGMTCEREANRARANAIQALMQMRTGEALGALSRMLGDHRPEHRTSALWLVETIGVAEVARDVAEMSITEPDPEVRGRAGRVIQRIIEQMSQPVAIQQLLDEPILEPREPGRAAAG